MTVTKRNCAIALACPFVYAIASGLSSFGVAYIIGEVTGFFCSGNALRGAMVLGTLGTLGGLVVGLGVAMANLVDNVSDHENLKILIGTTITTAVGVLLLPVVGSLLLGR